MLTLKTRVMFDNYLGLKIPHPLGIAEEYSKSSSKRRPSWKFSGITEIKLTTKTLRYSSVKSYKSIKAFLKTLNAEERKKVQWSIDVLMVEYWEVLTQESEEGKDHGGITVPVGGYYLSISMDLIWYQLKLNATVLEVKLLDNYELISRKNDGTSGGYY
jgi:hypothetical protein